MEAREEEGNSQEQSESRHSHNKSRQIKKSPKPNKRPPEQQAKDKPEPIESSLRITSQYGVFESEMQKQSRLQKFWLIEIDNYYRKEIKPKEIDMLRNITEEPIPSLNDVISHSLPHDKPIRVPFDQLFRYVELIHECRHGGQLLLVQNDHQHFLAVFEGQHQLIKLIEITQEEGLLVRQRLKFMNELELRQDLYNRRHNTEQKLSELTSEMAFLLYLMRNNKAKIDNSISCILQRISQQKVEKPTIYDQARDKYIICLIRKNLRKALLNTPIDYLNYYATLDVIQQYGSVDPDQEKPITDKKEFEEYIKRKKSKKSRKNNRGILKTACAACLSPHFEQYNPLFHCTDCQTRFHKYCYTPFKDGLCETCFSKKEPVSRGRNLECQLCSVRGLLTVPQKSNKQVVSMHVFCMLINGLWKFQNGALEFKPSSLVNPNSNNDTCSICNLAVYTYPCKHCQAKAHPLCAYINGWSMELGERGVELECSCMGVPVEEQSYRRKFILNYKKILYKSDRDR